MRPSRASSLAAVLTILAATSAGARVRAAAPDHDDAPTARVPSAKTVALERRREIARKRLARVARSERKALRYVQKGLRSKLVGEGIRMFRLGISSSHRGLRSLDKLERRHGKDPIFTSQAAPVRKRLQEHAINAGLHLASSYSVRQSYHRALTAVNEAIALDPTNERALAQRARIEYSAAVSGGYGGYSGYRYPIVGRVGIPGGRFVRRAKSRRRAVRR